MKSKILCVRGIVVILFVNYQRAFIIDIREIKRLTDSGKKSININDIDSIKHYEIPIIQNNRKKYLRFDYVGDFKVYGDI